jgi:hypothetical protein
MSGILRKIYARRAGRVKALAATSPLCGAEWVTPEECVRYVSATPLSSGVGVCIIVVIIRVPDIGLVARPYRDAKEPATAF